MGDGCRVRIPTGTGMASRMLTLRCVLEAQGGWGKRRTGWLDPFCKSLLQISEFLLPNAQRKSVSTGRSTRYPDSCLKTLPPWTGSRYLLLYHTDHLLTSFQSAASKAGEMAGAAAEYASEKAEVSFFPDSPGSS